MIDELTLNTAEDERTRDALRLLPSGWTVTREVIERVGFSQDEERTETIFLLRDSDGVERSKPRRYYVTGRRGEPGEHVVSAGVQVSHMAADEAIGRAVVLLLAAYDCKRKETK